MTLKRWFTRRVRDWRNPTSCSSRHEKIINRVVQLGWTVVVWYQHRRSRCCGRHCGRRPIVTKILRDNQSRELTVLQTKMSEDFQIISLHIDTFKIINYAYFRLQEFCTTRLYKKKTEKSEDKKMNKCQLSTDFSTDSSWQNYLWIYEIVYMLLRHISTSHISYVTIKILSILT